MTESWAIETAGLRYAYPDGAPALDGITMAVAPGERVGLIGANGAGKSTLLLHFNGILRPQEGVVRIFGKTIAPDTLPTVRRDVGLLFQNPDDQLFCASVFEDVAFGPRNMKLPEAEVLRRVQYALCAVRLEGYGARNAHHLSFGQKRRAALATVLSMEPKVLVFDEPSANLDPRGRRELLALLDSMPQAMVIATHNLGFVRTICSRCILLETGKVVRDGPTEDILGDELFLQEHGL